MMAFRKVRKVTEVEIHLWPIEAFFLSIDHIKGPSSMNNNYTEVAVMAYSFNQQSPHDSTPT